jgi:hypothetical protein
VARPTAWPKDEAFDHLPTFDALKERSGLKAYALRERLKEVPCFKCADNTVRYSEAEAVEAIEPEPGADEIDAGAGDAPCSDPVATALATTNKTLALFSTTVRVLNETIRVMGEPQKRGMELTNQAVAVLVARLDKYDAMWDRMVVLVEDLQSTQAERDEKKRQQTERQAMRRETFDLAKQYLPSAIEKFALTLEAQAALDLLGSVDPENLEALITPEMGLVPAEHLPKARKLVDALKARRREQQPKEGKRDAVETATTEAPETPTPAEPAAKVSEPQPG